MIIPAFFYAALRHYQYYTIAWRKSIKPTRTLLQISQILGTTCLSSTELAGRMPRGYPLWIL